MQRGASVIAAQCIGHRSALHCASQRSAFVPRPWCRIRRIGMLEDVRLARLHPSDGRQVRPMLLLLSKSRPYPRDRNASPFARKPFLPVKSRPRYWGEINFNPARSHPDINSALLTRSRLCAWECLATCGQNAFSVNPARKYALPVLGLADTWAKRGMLNRSVNFTSRLALTATLVTEKPSALA